LIIGFHVTVKNVWNVFFLRHSVVVQTLNQKASAWQKNYRSSYRTTAYGLHDTTVWACANFGYSVCSQLCSFTSD